ncbi:serine/threonine-protein kinase Nek5 isoform X2 [Nematostella vectensis]|uniref:serine/threonine-protein kinase Nek5 isoform X2 n=1 Tax=Nematostella vectensis TaxID=45351 RepID=UPI002076D9F3|nr:serine/threonine-protein kinase Nek5 isoform X2 [Nematostella vectensis]
MEMERFEVLHTLGAGGGGKVLLAKEKDSGRQVAIKEIILDSKRKTRTKEAVQREANILGQLKHPHIVTLLDSFVDKHEEKLYIVQDYCDGGTLQDQIALAKRNNIPLEEPQIMQWFVQVLMAVHHIHSRKILHRDLKSQNIFLTKKGMHSVVRLGDFGIARMMENTFDMAQTCCGTPCYLSPELCQDIPYSSKADVWALGCLLFEMCALRYAFDATNIISLFYKIVKGEPGDIPPQYSSPVKEVIQLMLTKKPEERPSAGLILNLPFIQQHLKEFIEEKENLQEALHARHHLKGSARNSPAVLDRPVSAGGNMILKTDEVSGKKNNKQRAKTALAKVHTPTLELKKEGKEVNEKSENNGDNASDYSDDFDESEEEVYSDEFDEDLALNGSLKTPIPSSDATSPWNGGRESGDNEVEYADDFEEDSDEEEVLDDLLANARAAQAAEEEEIVEDDDQSVSCKQILRSHVMDALGKKVFEEVCERARNEDDQTARFWFRPDMVEFERITGSELMETCYLVNELFIDGQPDGQSEASGQGS